MNDGDVGMLDLDCGLVAGPPEGEVGRGAQDQNRDLAPGRVLGTIVPVDRGLFQQLKDAYPALQDPAQYRFAPWSRVSSVLVSLVGNGGHGQRRGSRDWEWVGGLGGRRSFGA